MASPACRRRSGSTSSLRLPHSFTTWSACGSSTWSSARPAASCAASSFGTCHGRSASTVVGALSAGSMGPAATAVASRWFDWWGVPLSSAEIGGSVIFLVGLVGMTVCDALIRGARRWRDGGPPPLLPLRNQAADRRDRRAPPAVADGVLGSLQVRTCSSGRRGQVRRLCRPSRPVRESSCDRSQDTDTRPWPLGYW